MIFKYCFKHYKLAFLFFLVFTQCSNIRAQRVEETKFDQSVKNVYSFSSGRAIDSAFKELTKGKSHIQNGRLNRKEQLALDNLCTYIAIVLINGGEIVKAEDYAQKLKVGTNKASSYFRIAKSFESVHNQKLEKKYAELSIDTAIFYIKNNKGILADDKESQTSILAASAHLLANLLIQNGQSKEAIVCLDKSIPFSSEKNAIGLQMDKADAYYNLRQYEPALNIYWAILKTGSSETAVKPAIMKNYIAMNSNSDSAKFNEYYQDKWNSFRNVFLDSIKKSEYKIKSPEFSLRDYQGNIVKLIDLKGKVVILDFWATWCVPCKASFPAMQAVQNKFKNQNDVVFLFIDTWEYTSQPQEAVQQYLNKNKYDFKALFDLKDKKTGECSVVKSFGVTGVPAKFVIDQNGYIRYKLVGYNGNVDATIEELSLMINTLKKSDI